MKLNLKKKKKKSIVNKLSNTFLNTFLYNKEV